MKSIVKKSIAIGCLLVALIVLLILKENVAVCEWFATAVFPAWVFFAGHVSSVFSFSVFELLLYLAVLFAVTFLVWTIVLLCQRKWTKGANKFLTLTLVALCILTVYFSTAGMAYNREKLPIISYDHKTTTEKIDIEKAMDLAVFYADKLDQVNAQLQRNQDGTVKMPSFEEIYDLLVLEFEKLDDDYFAKYSPKAKTLSSQWIFSNLSIAGVSFSVTGEPNVNLGCANFYNLPSVLAHEMAHSKGVMRESDANSVAYYLLLNSDNPYLQYSVLADVSSAISKLVRSLQRQENPNAEVNFTFSSLLQPQTSVEVVADKIAYSAYWKDYQILDKFGTWLNDTYLKLMGQKDGVGSYVEDGSTQIQDKTDENGNQVQVQVVVSFSNLQNILIDHYLSEN